MQDVLYLTHRIPYPPNKGDKVRSYHFLKYLSARYRVHLATFVDDADDWRHVEAVRKLCGESHFAGLNPVTARIASLTGLLRRAPLSLSYYRDEGLRRWVNELVGRLSLKHIVVFSSVMAQYVMRAGDARRIVDFVDVDSDKWKQYALTKPWPLSLIYKREAGQLLGYEREVAQAFDASVFVSDAEAELFRQLAPESAAKIHAIHNGVDAEYFSPQRDYANPYGAAERVLVFTGAMDYWPNVDAAEWFARKIFPAVHARWPDSWFYIVGARPAPAVMRLAELPGVVVTGTVADIRPYLAHAAVAVAPLRIARGIQNKVLEAMAMAKPVIASTEAAEGIGARPGEELLVAAGEDEFVAAIHALLADGDGAGIGRAGRERVVADYSWDANISRIESLIAPEYQTGGGANRMITPESSTAGRGREWIK